MKHIFSLLICLSFFQLYSYKIGLCIVATGKYIDFVAPLIESANKYFCNKHSINYFIFTDNKTVTIANAIIIYQERLGWPYDTMMRPGIYYQQADLLKSMDYIFSCDADMRFVNEVGDEILHDRVATLHPGYVGTKGTYETNSISTACLNPHEGDYYFAGGFWGGCKNEFLTMAKIIDQNIKIDLSRNYIAIWHDESHLNRYFFDHKPTVILSPSYCYPESLNLPYEKKLIALDKNHAFMRS